jgi:hypothetical protein
MVRPGHAAVIVRDAALDRHELQSQNVSVRQLARSSILPKKP